MWPPPPDTEDVRLPAEVEAVLELLAEHAHDTWARKRLAEGWQYAWERSDDKPTHPNLVPYDELSEADKAYDRQIVSETVRKLIRLGFSVERRTED